MKLLTLHRKRSLPDRGAPLGAGFAGTGRPCSTFCCRVRMGSASLQRISRDGRRSNSVCRCFAQSLRRGTSRIRLHLFAHFPKFSAPVFVHPAQPGVDPMGPIISLTPSLSARRAPHRPRGGKIRRFFVGLVPSDEVATGKQPRSRSVESRAFGVRIALQLPGG